MTRFDHAGHQFIGRFVAFDLLTLLGDPESAETDASHPSIAPDPMLETGAYDRFRRAEIVSNGALH